MRSLVRVKGEIIATSLAAAETVEQAEDRSRGRLFELLEIASASHSPLPETLPEPSLSVPETPVLSVAPQPHRSNRLSATEAIDPEPEAIAPDPPATLTPIPVPETLVSDTSENVTLPISAPASPRETETATTSTATLEATTNPIDFTNVIAQTSLEIKRLQWTQEQGKNYLIATYGKRSRQLLTDEELLEFLEYLRQQPTPQ